MELPVNPIDHLLPKYIKDQEVHWLEYSIPKRSFKINLIESALQSYMDNILGLQIVDRDEYRPIYVSDLETCKQFQGVIEDIQLNPKSIDRHELTHYFEKMQEIVFSSLIAFEYSIKKKYYHSGSFHDSLLDNLKAASVIDQRQSADYRPVYIGLKDDSYDFGDLLRSVNK